MNYAVVMKRTNFNNDGSFCSSFDHLVARTRTLKEAKESVDYLNKSHANANAHVMNAVKKKNVDMYDNRIEEYRVVKDKKRVGSVDYWDLQKGK